MQRISHFLLHGSALGLVAAASGWLVWRASQFQLAFETLLLIGPVSLVFFRWVDRAVPDRGAGHPTLSLRHMRSVFSISLRTLVLITLPAAILYGWSEIMATVAVPLSDHLSSFIASLPTRCSADEPGIPIPTELPRVVSSLVTMWGIGLLLEWAYVRTLVGHMMRSSTGKGSESGRDEQISDHRQQLDTPTENAPLPAVGVRLVPSNGTTVPGQAARKLLARVGRRQLLEALPSFMGVTVLLGTVWPDPEIQPAEAAETTALVLGILLLSWLGWRFQWDVRSPIRQIRLTVVLVIALAASALAGLLGLLAPLSLRIGSRDGHWWILRRVTAAVDRLFSLRVLVVWLFIVYVLGERFDSFDAEPPIWILPAYAVGAGVAAGLRRYFRKREVRHHLILLRVFGDERRGRFLARRIAPAWLGIGNVAYIVAPDVAVTTLGARELFDAAYGHLRDYFSDRARISEASMDRQFGPHSDIDAPVLFHCNDDVWLPTLRRLIGIPHSIVLMDLRGFGAQNRGCITEIHELIESVSVRRIVLVTDSSTDMHSLRGTLNTAWSRRTEHSVNADALMGDLRVVEMETIGRRRLKVLLTQLAEAAASPHEARRASPVSSRSCTDR